MEIYRIDPSNARYYQDLIPADFVSLLYREELVQFGIVDEKDGEGIPAGLMVVSTADPDAYTIEWLFISKEYQGNGLGDDFISFLMEMAKKDGKPYVLLRSYTIQGAEEPEYEEGAYPLESWFRDRGFAEFSSDVSDRIYYFNAMKSDLVSEGLKQYDAALSLKDVSDKELENLYKYLEKKYGYSFKASIDKDVSAAVIDGGKLKMAFIVRRFGDAFVPLEVYSPDNKWNGDTFKNLLLSTLKNCCEATKGEGYIHFCGAGRKMLSAIDGLFEESSAVESTLSRAPSDSYDRLLRAVNYDMIQTKESRKALEAIPEDAEIVDVEYYSGVRINN